MISAAAAIRFLMIRGPFAIWRSLGGLFPESMKPSRKAIRSRRVPRFHHEKPMRSLKADTVDLVSIHEGRHRDRPGHFHFLNHHIPGRHRIGREIALEEAAIPGAA